MRVSLFSLCLIFGLALPTFAAPVRRHVVLVVWDGMRPDFVTEECAPNLDRLAKSGVRFNNNRAVYFSATDVNGAAIATGRFPNGSGIFANLDYRPQLDPIHPVDTGTPETIRLGDEKSGGKYLTSPTFVEQLRAAGKTVALVGTKGVTLLFDRHNEWSVSEMSGRPLAVFTAAPMSAALHDELVKTLGPPLVDPHALAPDRDRYATRALTEILWRDRVPDFSLLWLSQPDWSEHNFAPGSPEARAAIKSSDDNLRLVLDALEKKSVRTDTDVFVISDHGFSTIRRSIDLIAELKAEGFRAMKDFSAQPKPGDVLVCGNGGSVSFYVRDQDAPTIEKLIGFLQKKDYVDSLFSSDGRFETKRFSDVSIDVAAPPSLVLAFKWSNEKNQFGTPGMIDADWNRPAGEGTHASLSEFDRHNTLIAAGVDLRQGFQDNLASGNIDLAPTILHLLGVEGGKFQGRELREAYAEK